MNWKNDGGILIRAMTPKVGKFFNNLPYGWMDPEGNVYKVPFLEHETWIAEVISKILKEDIEKIPDYQYMSNKMLAYNLGWYRLGTYISKDDPDMRLFEVDGIKEIPPMLEEFAKAINCTIRLSYRGNVPDQG